ncbi:MAG: hypothetical protein HN929_13835 [Chloroflexi bacterium]|nr:hypothetical protein [Chloroflexota bacterium]
MLKRALLAASIAVLLVGCTACFPSTTSEPSATNAEVEAGIFDLVNAERTEQGLAALTRNTSLDTIAREYATNKFTQATSYSTNIVYMLSNTWELSFEGATVSLTADTAADQVEFCISEPTLYNALLSTEATETGVGVVSVGSTVYFVQLFDVIRGRGADDQPIILVENPEATDPTWGQLEIFLNNDATDEIEYDLDTFICGDFAETLHNNAEAAGIRAAYVPVRLNVEPGHALNAFNVDGTTVFIDAIGGDKVAYMEIGKDFGVIRLDAAQAFTYTYFETYVQDFDAFQISFDDCNAQIVAYNRGDDPPAPYATLQEWSTALTTWAAQLDADKIRLGLDGAYFSPTESLDTVDPNVVSYYIHW